MPITIKHGGGVEALAMAYGTQAEATYQRELLEKQREAEKKAKRRQKTNTAIMAGIGAAAIAAPFLTPAIFAGPAFSAGSKAAGQAYAAGMNFPMTGLIGQAAQQSYLATATAAVQAGITGLGTAYQAFTPTEEQSAVGNAVFAAGSAVGQIKSQVDQRQADLANQLVRQQQMGMFRSELQWSQWQRMQLEKGDVAVHDYMQQWRRTEQLHQTIDNIKNGVAVEQFGASDLPALEKEYSIRSSLLQAQELKLTEQVSHTGRPMSLEQAQLASNDMKLQIAQARDNEDIQTAEQLTQVYTSQMLPQIDQMVAQRATPAQVQQADDLARRQIIAEKTADRHPWIPFIGQEMSTQQAVQWLDNTEEGQNILYQRRRRLLRQQYGLE